ncbi:MAG: GDP-mannose 4,6-dehydratase, partial [Phycisphaeraceae bacterium]|nr:GDP-mannose 4,6-dehydratase [Phycisphaeraceae bacterium]
MAALTDYREKLGDRYHGRHVLVTGGAGFIGSHLSKALVQLGAEVVVIDNLDGGDRANLEPAEAAGPGSLTFMEASILDTDALAEATAGCRRVFHQAALGSVPRSMEEPDLYTRVNIVGTHHVLEAARA